MRKRYPATLGLVGILAVLGLFIVLSLIWEPALWIVLGVFWAVMLGLAIRDDRRSNRAG